VDQTAPVLLLFVIFGACLIPSIISFYDATFNDHSWTIQDRALWIFISGIIATLICIPLRRFEKPKSREKISEFFKTMYTPVDFAKEIGHSTDHQQAKLVGYSTLLIGASAALLLLMPNDLAGRLWILLFSGRSARSAWALSSIPGASRTFPKRHLQSPSRGVGAKPSSFINAKTYPFGHGFVEAKPWTLSSACH
jgi:hypothetical protein